MSLRKNISTGNASPYSTGLPGASLTSTSVDPHTATSTALFDEVCHSDSFNGVRIRAYINLPRKNSCLTILPTPQKEKVKRKMWVNEGPMFGW